MEKRWMSAPEILGVLNDAASRAQLDENSEVSPWHILLALLEFSDTRREFCDPRALRVALLEKAESDSDHRFREDKLPELPETLREKLFGEMETLRKRAGQHLPQPVHFVRALFLTGSEQLQELMHRFGYDEQRDPDHRILPRDRDSDRHLPASDAEALAAYTVEMVEAARRDPLFAVSGRRRETDALLRTLVRRKKCCPVLLGDPGVGKTAIVEALARRIADHDVPQGMENCKIYSLNSGNLIAGAWYRGQYEGRLRCVVNAVKHQEHAILFVDELHALLTSGTNSGDALNAGNILKPELASGELRFIGATTESEFRKFIETDGALTRRFTPIPVAEPTAPECLAMLQCARPAMEKYYRVKLPDPVLKAALTLAAKFLPQRNFPDKVFDVLDDAAAEHLLQNGASISRLELQTLENSVARMAKLPRLPEMKKSPLAGLGNLRKKFRQTIFGQDAAVDALCRAVKLAESGFSLTQTGTRGSFFFNGPTGVGKTEIARQLARLLEIPLVKFDMTEYADASSVSRLIGAAPGLVGYDEGGLLINAIRQTPHCVLLLDEIEKAHPAIHRLLLQIMDAGCLTDNRGQKADFRELYLIMTGNVRKSGFRAVGFGDAPADEVSSVLTECFAPEFRARLTETIAFEPLSRDALQKIIDSKFKLLQHKAKTQGYRIALTDAARDEFIRRAMLENAGARPIITLIERFAALPLVEKILANTMEKQSKLDFAKGELFYA